MVILLAPKTIRISFPHSWIIPVRNRATTTSMVVQFPRIFSEPDRACGYVENIGRDHTCAKTLTMAELLHTEVNMFTTVFIGNSQSEIIDGKLVTKRGYRL